MNEFQTILLFTVIVFALGTAVGYVGAIVFPLADGYSYYYEFHDYNYRTLYHFEHIYDYYSYGHSTHHYTLFPEEIYYEYLDSVTPTYQEHYTPSWWYYQ